MPTDRGSAARQCNIALISIYYFGRKASGALAGTLMPPNLLSLDEAVAKLTKLAAEEGIRDLTLPCVRLAIADLARARGASKPTDSDEDKRPSGREGRIASQIGKLAETYSRLIDPNGSDADHERRARFFTDLTRRIPGSEQPDPFVRLLNAMREAEGDRFDRGGAEKTEPTRPVLLSYTVTRDG